MAVTKGWLENTGTKICVEDIRQMQLEQLVQLEDFLESDEGMQAALMESFSDLVVESSVLLVMNRIGIYPNAIDTGKFARIRYFSSFPLFSSIAALTNAVSTAKIEMVKRAIKEAVLGLDNGLTEEVVLSYFRIENSAEDMALMRKVAEAAMRRRQAL